MTIRYQIGGWIDTVIEIRHAVGIDEYFAFATAIQADAMLNPYLHQLSAQGGPAVGAVLADQEEQTTFYRLSCPAFLAEVIFAQLRALLQEHMPPTPSG